MINFVIPIAFPVVAVQHLFDSVQGGVYSGWCHELSVQLDPDGVPNGDRKHFVRFDKEGGPEGAGNGRMTVRVENVIAGLKAMAEQHPVRFGRSLRDECDAEDADIFLQCLVFGKEVYA